VQVGVVVEVEVEEVEAEQLVAQVLVLCQLTGALLADSHQHVLGPEWFSEYKVLI